MASVVYTSEQRTPMRQLLSPARIFNDLWQHREVLRAFIKRDFHASYRGTHLGLAWALLSPLIMLAMFSFVFGGIFHGRFTADPNETGGDFALAMFVGLSLFLCLGQTLGSSPTLVLANAAYVKTLNFPLQVLSVSAVAQAAINMAIGLVLCLVMFFILHNDFHPATVCLIPIAGCVILLSLGCSWLLSAVGVFLRDTPSIVGPISTVLMFMSGVFFSIESVPASARFLVKFNPLAVLIDEARAALMNGTWPPLAPMAGIGLLAALAAILGYAVFMRMKPAFADVI